MKRTRRVGLILLAALGVPSPAAAQGMPNLGNFEYYSIQPSVSTVKAGETITLTIRTCGPESRAGTLPVPAGDDDLVPLPNLDGNPNTGDDGLVALPDLCHVGPAVKASKLTATAGKVMQVNPTTLQFTAPSNRNINPVTITATYLKANGTRASISLSAKVIIDGVQVYQGSAGYNYRQGSTSKSISTKVKWTFQGGAGGMSMYVPSGTISAKLLDQDCQGSGTVPITGGQLMFLPGANTTYQYIVNGKTGITLTCKDGRKVTTPPLSLGLGCTNHDNGQQAFVDLTALSGGCRDSTSSHAWNFVAVK